MLKNYWKERSHQIFNCRLIKCSLYNGVSFKNRWLVPGISCNFPVGRLHPVVSILIVVLCVYIDIGITYYFYCSYKI